MAISMLKIRRPLGRLIFNMGIAIPGKTVFLIETAPWLPRNVPGFGNGYTKRHKPIPRGSNGNTKFLIRENAFENVIWEMSAMLSRGWGWMWGWGKMRDPKCIATSLHFSGNAIGTIIAFAFSGLLIKSGFLGGWPSVFYVFGKLTLTNG